MRTKSNSSKILESESGLITIDFMFSFIMTCMFCFLFFAITYSLLVVEVSQYIAFAVARSHSGGHMTIEAQIDQGNKKFQELRNDNKIIRSLYNPVWFDLQKPTFSSGGANGTPFETNYPAKCLDPVSCVPAIGVRLVFNAKILAKDLPLIGSTGDKDTGFLAGITGLILREPSVEECQDQMKYETRYQSILNLDPRYKSLGPTDKNKYLALEDNGC